MGVCREEAQVSLVGKFFLSDCGDMYRTGEFVASSRLAVE